MKYILDTDILIYFLKGEASIVRKMMHLKTEEIHTTIITHSELLFGAYHSRHVEKNVQKITQFLNTLSILPYDQDASKRFGHLKSLLKQKGQLIADMDLMIASICLSRNATLVTNNGRHFERIPHLKLSNWIQSKEKDQR